MKYKVIKEHEDHASRLRLGDVVDFDLDLLKSASDIANIGGAHYKVSELDRYFRIVKNRKPRQVCARYIHKVAIGKSQFLVSEKECSFTKYYNRRRTLKDIAGELESIAFSMRKAHDDPEYDPFGITYHRNFVDTFSKYLKNLSEVYRNQVVKDLLKKVT